MSKGDQKSILFELRRTKIKKQSDNILPGLVDKVYNITLTNFSYSVQVFFSWLDTAFLEGTVQINSSYLLSFLVWYMN